MTARDKAAELREKKRIAELGGGPAQIERQRKLGKLTARERIDLLLDPGTFSERGMLVTHHCTDFGMDRSKYFGDGVVTGSGKIDGRLVFIYAQDFTVFGGSLGESHALKIADIMTTAIRVGAPIIGLLDSGGARIQEGPSYYSKIFRKNVEASGWVPQITAILGPCSGGATISPSLGDFIFIVEGIGHMFATGPGVVKALTGEEVTAQDLGGGRVHVAKSGLAHFGEESEAECFKKMKHLLSFLPANCKEAPPELDPTDDPDRREERLGTIFYGKDPYDMKQIVSYLVDHGNFMEVQEEFARNIIIGFGRLNGKTVGMIANQPLVLNGMMDMDAADKLARFVRFCDAFNIPMINLVDCPGYFGGKEQEHRGLIRHASKMVYAYCEATVPRIAVAVRRVYGAGLSGMGMSKDLGTDIVFALPSAEIAVMGPEAAVNVLFKKEVSQAEDPEEMRMKKIEEYRERFANPYVAAERGWIDAVIEPKEIRPKLIRVLEDLKGKMSEAGRRKHGIIPV
jgi:acetyl-CoA carboxylase carboxyltransferase component